METVCRKAPLTLLLERSRAMDKTQKQVNSRLEKYFENPRRTAVPLSEKPLPEGQRKEIVARISLAAAEQKKAKFLKKSGKPKALPLTEQQREEKVKMILLVATERKRRKRANREIGYLLQQHNKSPLELLPLIKWRHPFWLTVAIEIVEEQRSRNELSKDDLAWFKEFKISLKQEEEKK